MENSTRILIVDDERPIRRFLTVSLGGQYTILEAATGEEALSMAATGRPDAILLDLGLPDIDGVEATRQLWEWTQVPIIVITVREQESDKIAAFDAGADDYLTKPFSVVELMARLRLALRWAASPELEPAFNAGEVTMDLVHREVTLGERHINLTPTEYDILRILVKNAGKVLTHQQLIHAVWGNNYEAESHLLRVNISNLRRKIEVDPARPRLIMTESGVGYRLKTA